MDGKIGLQATQLLKLLRTREILDGETVLFQDFEALEPNRLSHLYGQHTLTFKNLHHLKE